MVHAAAPPLGNQAPELNDVLEKALAKEPKERYQHAGDLALDLRRFKSAWESNSLPSARGASSPARGRPVGWLVAAAVLILALPVAWWFGRRAGLGAQDLSGTRVSITPFTTEPGYQGEPTISPDGQTIAYVSDRSGHFDIYLRQVGATSDIALTHDQGDNIQPAFSPDGRQIAFVSSRAGGSGVFYTGFDNPTMGGDIWVMSALGGSARRIVKEGNAPAWSPDGSKIAFTRNRRGVLEVPAAGGEPREVGTRLAGVQWFYPAYSSDGQWIFFEDNVQTIQAIRVDGSSLHQIATGRHPVWDTSSRAGDLYRQPGGQQQLVVEHALFNQGREGERQSEADHDRPRAGLAACSVEGRQADRVHRYRNGVQPGDSAV